MTVDGERRLSIVLPTFNERDNLPRVIARIDDVMGDHHWGYEAIVVDDDSPDLTWQIGEALAEEYPVRTIRRTEDKGLARAVVRGFEEATHDSILVIDADMQHPPERIPDLLEELEQGHDIVIASRFANGGSSGEFSVVRLSMSIVANILAKLLFPRLRGIGDLQSGFFVVRRSVIRNVTFRPIGYKILIEVLVRGDHNSVSEIGYVFRERDEGSSAMGLDTIVDYLRHLWRLRRD